MIISQDYKEQAFEKAIVEGFEKQGWETSENDEGYDRNWALYLPDLFRWLETAYPKKFKAFKQTQTDYKTILIDAIEDLLKTKGTLWILRNSITVIGFGAFKLCESKPEDQRNPEVSERYKKNILRVMRQVHFRADSSEALDLAFFINGIPVATGEVKTNFTQDVNEAVEQYKKDRIPKPKKGKTESPLLKPERGAVVHFAISETDIQMTTRLEGDKTRFLPFNKGYKGHAGNPAPSSSNPYGVSYFWKELGKKDAWIGLFQNFVFIEESHKFNQFGLPTISRKMIFPRYHQWRAVTKMINDAKKRGPGQKYLIEHSAGSGKTKTITWTAFQLSKLRDKDGNALFDTILIISDRKVLDTQLSKAVTQFNSVEGLVEPITSKGGSKTNALVEALEGGKRIVVVTIQTFPFAMEQIIFNDKLKGKHFAVIFDEAHNSQAGSGANRLNASLGSADLKNQDLTIAEFLEQIQKSRRRPDNVSYFGFTATPKHQTFMLFGRKRNGEPLELVKDGRINKDSPEDQKPVSFDKYPMRQAIEEGFIKDVMKGFMPYETAYKLGQATETAKNSAERLDSDRTKKALAKWKVLHPTNVSQKTEFIIDHFRRNIAGMLHGQAKAMIVTSSRAAVVRYQHAFRHYLKAHPEMENVPILRIGIPLAAFSGEILGKDVRHSQDFTVTEGNMAWVELINDEEVYSESSLNPNVSFAQEGALENAFESDDYRIMIVANKFQTGFDQPKLCALYIDKVMANPVEIVQTYSRVNRIFPGKDKVFIVDFVNKPANVLKAFRMYDSGAVINDIQNPQVLENLRVSILSAGIFDENAVNDFVSTYFSTHYKNYLNGGKVSSEGHEILEKIFGEAARKFTVQFQNAFDRCNDYELEHQNAVKNKNLELASAIDKLLLEASKDYETLKLFKSNLSKFLSGYNYIAQVAEINEGSLEGFATYCSYLRKRLGGILPKNIDLSSVILTHYSLNEQAKLRKKNKEEQKEEGSKEIALEPIKGGTHKEVEGKLPEYLRIILDEVSNFAGDLASVADTVNYCYAVADKVKTNEKALFQIQNNPKETAKKGEMDSAVNQAVFDLLTQNQNFAALIAKDGEKYEQLKDIIYELLTTERHIGPDLISNYLDSEHVNR